MTKITVDWNDIVNWQRLIAAVVATDVKIDLHETAKYFGCSYDTVQNRMRPVKAKAAELKAENGEEVSPRTPAKRTKSKLLDKVTTGRVKKTPPTKKNTTAVKKEFVDDDDDESMAGLYQTAVEDFGPDMGDEV